MRLTWQMASKHKFSAYLDRIVKFRGHECPALSAEEACGIRSPKRYFTAQAKYTATLSSRLLRRSRLLGERRDLFDQRSAGERRTGRDRAIRPHDDRSAGAAPQGPYYFRVPDRYTYTRLGVVCDRHARGQDRGAVRQRRQPPSAIDAERRRPDSGVPQQGAGVGERLQHAAVVGGADQVRPRHLSAGLVDAEAADAQPRHALRAVQHFIPKEVVAGRPVRADARVRPDREPAELEGLGAAPRRRLRRVGRRQDGDQGARGKVHARVLDRRLRAGLQPDAAGDRSPDVDRSERRRHRAGQRDRTGRHAVQHQRRHQPRGRSGHHAAVPVGVQPRPPARGRHRRVGVVQLGAPRLQPAVLDRQHADDVRRLHA